MNILGIDLGGTKILSGLFDDGSGPGVFAAGNFPGAAYGSPNMLRFRGGVAGSGPYSAECPFVVQRKGSYYLFRTQRYGKTSQTTVYRSKDPRDFGIDDDRCRVGTLDLAAPEIFQHEGQDYIAFLLPSLKGIQIQKLSWEPKK